MSVQVKRRREAAAFLAGYVGAPGELLVDTTNNRVQVHDGATPGGWPAARFKVPTVTVLTALSGTYSPPTGASWIKVRMIGGGAGGGSGSGGGTGSAGNPTTFGSLSAAGGLPGSGISGALNNAVPTTGDVNFPGNGGVDGETGVAGMTLVGGSGGASPFAGGGRSSNAGKGGNGPPNSGAGGGGAGVSGALQSGGGGGAGAYLEKTMAVSAPATFAYLVGALASGGSAGTSGFNGGTGAGGIILVEEHYD